MSDSWLTPDEVLDLTARKRWSAQCRALAAMGVAFMPNAVGRPLVQRSAVLSEPSKRRSPKEPNWDAIKRKVA
jgi:hypothetical protein